VKRIPLGAWMLFLAVLLGCAATEPTSTTDVPKITKDELRARLNDPQVVILDVRLQEQWDESDRKITGSSHENPDKVQDWIGNYAQNKTYVLLCA